MYINLLEYGVISDGKTLNTNAFKNAINDISNQGGGTLFVPPGKFLTGSICLEDNTYIYLSPGAEVIASPNYDDFIAAESEVVAESSYRGFIFAKGKKNVGLLGYGTINGNAPAYNAEEADELGYRQPQKERIRTLIFEDCTNVSLEGITVIDSPMWTLHFVSCDYGRISDVKVLNSFKYTNTDAIDIDGCSNFHITGCQLRTADDGVCLKTSKKQGELDRPCENILVDNCIIHSHSSALKNWD